MHELRLGREVDRGEGGAGELARLAGEKADRALLAERAGERVRQAQERLTRALQRALELPEGCALDDERRGAGFEHPLDGLLVVETRERDDAGLGSMRANLSRRLDPVEPSHPDVHEHDVGLELGRECNRGLAVGCFAHDLDFWMIREDCANEPACFVRVVADQ